MTIRMTVTPSSLLLDHHHRCHHLRSSGVQKVVHIGAEEEDTTNVMDSQRRDNDNGQRDIDKFPRDIKDNDACHHYHHDNQGDILFQLDNLSSNLKKKSYPLTSSSSIALSCKKSSSSSLSFPRSHHLHPHLHHSIHPMPQVSTCRPLIYLYLLLVVILFSIRQGRWTHNFISGKWENRKNIRTDYVLFFLPRQSPANHAN